MKAVSFFVGVAGGILIFLAGESGPLLTAGESDSAERPKQREQVQPALLRKIRPLYPNVQLVRRGAAPFFSRVKEIARVRLHDGKQRLVVRVGVTVPAGRVDHGWGELLIFRDADDALPMVRTSTFSIPLTHGSKIHLVAQRWLQFGTESLVSLVDEKSIKNFGEHGTGILDGLSVVAVRKALAVYLNKGREAFLESAPLSKHREKHVALPDRISRFEIYPSLVEDMRDCGFKYSDAWEGTVLVRLTPARKPQKRIILEIGTGATSAGIISDQVKLLLWETREQEPTDRPAPFP